MTQSIVPTGRARVLGDDEIIVSKTDLRGHLTYVNDLFVDISGYEEADLLGKPHNVIRHPAMPRSVFGLLWETLQSGEELFAYVVNLCANGDHYWVFAHVTPTRDRSGSVTGYHSNRRSVSPRAVERVQRLYDRLLLAERRESGGRAATAAGTAELHAALGESGTTYDRWVWSLLEGQAA